MKPMIALLVLFGVACGKSSDGSSGTPTGPSAPTAPTFPTDRVDGGQWGLRAGLIEANSESAFAELNGKLYLLIWASGGGTSIGGSFGSLHNQVFFPTVSCD